MFQIKKYLQYKNTPDGKPRVLAEGVDYNTIHNNGLYLSKGETLGKYLCAIEYCRLLFTTTIENHVTDENRKGNGKSLTLTEMQVVYYKRQEENMSWYLKSTMGLVLVF
jgi:hypothetical protein